MPRTRIILFANLRELAGTKEIVLEGRTIRDILGSLCKKFPGFEDLFFEDRQIRPYINIFLNGKDINTFEGLESLLAENDEIAIFPPVSGGRCSRNG